MLLDPTIADSWFADFVTEFNTTAGSGATLQFWDGTIPTLITDPDTGTQITSHPCSNPPLLAASGLSSAFDTIPSALATANGTITYARVYDTSSNPIAQFTCGTGSEEIVFDSVTFTIGDTLSITSLAIDAAIS